MAHIITPGEPLHHALLDLLPETFLLEIGDYDECNWHVLFSFAAHGMPSTAFCELAGSPIRAQILIDLQSVIYRGRPVCIRHGRHRRVPPTKADNIKKVLELITPLIKLHHF